MRKQFLISIFLVATNIFCCIGQDDTEPFRRVEGTNYFISLTKGSWGVAKIACHSRGMKLAIIKSPINVDKLTYELFHQFGDKELGGDTKRLWAGAHVKCQSTTSKAMSFLRFAVLRKKIQCGTYWADGTGWKTDTWGHEVVNAVPAIAKTCLLYDYTKAPTSSWYWPWPPKNVEFTFCDESHLGICDATGSSYVQKYEAKRKGTDKPTTTTTTTTTTKTTTSTTLAPEVEIVTTPTTTTTTTEIPEIVTTTEGPDYAADDNSTYPWMRINKCPAAASYPDPHLDCSKYIYCEKAGQGYKQMKCRERTQFDPFEKKCVSISYAKSCAVCVENTADMVYIKDPTKYYRCSSGLPHLLDCVDGFQFSELTKICEPLPSTKAEVDDEEEEEEVEEEE